MSSPIEVDIWWSLKTDRGLGHFTVGHQRKKSERRLAMASERSTKDLSIAFAMIIQ